MYLLSEAYLLLLLLITVACQNVQYEYSIEVPKYMCPDKQTLASGVTTIRLLGKDAQKLHYEFSVNFRGMDDCNHSQRCTLMAWRAVRNLERHLRNVSATQRTLQEINIDNAMLMPGIHYVLNVAVVSNGRNVDNKQFVLECTNESVTATSTLSSTSSTLSSTLTSLSTALSSFLFTLSPLSSSSSEDTSSEVVTAAQETTEELAVAEEVTTAANESAMNLEQDAESASLTLIGSNVTYRDMLYVLKAEVANCGLNCSFYFKWEVLDEDEKDMIGDEPVKGSELRLLAEKLNATKTYLVRCTALSDDSAAVASAVHNLTVLKREVILKLAVLTLCVGPKKNFRLHAYFKGDDISDETTVEWSCTYNHQKQCIGFNPKALVSRDRLHSIYLENRGFEDFGRYNITIFATKGNVTKEDWCEVQVVDNGYAKIYVDNVEEPVDPFTCIEVPVYVADLSTGCMLQWTSVRKENYDYVQLYDAPGKLDIITNITLKEDEFLNEIDEFTNSTADIDYNLKIPPREGVWNGLKGNSSYLFRLNVTCPLNQEYEDSDEDAEPLLLQNQVSLYADVPVHTNLVPVLNSLDVVPKEGVALKTFFKFTHIADNADIDYPMLYKFGYVLNKQTVFVSTLLGVSTTKSVLPYIDSGVKTIMQGCNTRSLCTQIFGPTVTTKMPADLKYELNNLKGQLKRMINLEEYYNAFTFTLAILQSYSQNEDVIADIQHFITNLTSNEIKRLLMMSVDGETSWRTPATNLIKHMGLLLNNFSVPERLLNNVVALRNELSRRNTLKLRQNRSVRSYATRRLLMIQQHGNRFKREIEKVTLEEVRSYLVISELIITTSRDKRRVQQEQLNLLNQFDKFMPGLCSTLYQKTQTMNLELKTFIFSMEKINAHIFNRYIHILFPDNSWQVNGRIKLGRCFVENLKIGSQSCLVKAAFKNYLNKKGLIYMVKIFSSDGAEQYDAQNAACDAVLVFPLNEKLSFEKEAKCALWKKHWTQSPCKTLQVTSKTVQCLCSSLGYYAIEYNSVTPTISSEENTAVRTATPQVLKAGSTTSTIFKYSTTEEMKNSNEVVVKIPIETKDNVAQITTQNPFKETSLSTKLHPVQPETATKLEVSSTTTYSENKTSSNISLAGIYASEDENDVVLYFIIGFSLCGSAVLIYGIKQLLSKTEETTDDIFPKYAPIYHEEMLYDFSPSN